MYTLYNILKNGSGAERDAKLQAWYQWACTDSPYKSCPAHYLLDWLPSGRGYGMNQKNTGSYTKAEPQKLNLDKS